MKQKTKKAITVELTKVGEKDYVVDKENGYAKITYTLNGEKVKPIWVRDVGFCSPPLEVFYVKELNKILHVSNDIHYGTGTTIELLNNYMGISIRKKNKK